MFSSPHQFAELPLWIQWPGTVVGRRCWKQLAHCTSPAGLILGSGQSCFAGDVWRGVFALPEGFIYFVLNR